MQDLKLLPETKKFDQITGTLRYDFSGKRSVTAHIGYTVTEASFATGERTLDPNREPYGSFLPLPEEEVLQEAYKFYNAKFPTIVRDANKQFFAGIAPGYEALNGVTLSAGPAIIAENHSLSSALGMMRERNLGFGAIVSVDVNKKIPTGKVGFSATNLVAFSEKLTGRALVELGYAMDGINIGIGKLAPTVSVTMDEARTNTSSDLPPGVAMTGIGYRNGERVSVPLPNLPQKAKISGTERNFGIKGGVEISF